MVILDSGSEGRIPPSLSPNAAVQPQSTQSAQRDAACFRGMQGHSTEEEPDISVPSSRAYPDSVALSSVSATSAVQ